MPMDLFLWRKVKTAKFLHTDYKLLLGMIMKNLKSTVSALKSDIHMVRSRHHFTRRTRVSLTQLLDRKMLKKCGGSLTNISKITEESRSTKITKISLEASYQGLILTKIQIYIKCLSKLKYFLNIIIWNANRCNSKSLKRMPYWLVLKILTKKLQRYSFKEVDRDLKQGEVKNRQRHFKKRESSTYGSNRMKIQRETNDS